MVIAALPHLSRKYEAVMNWWIILLIVVILGFIFGNILLLKQSANFKFKKPDKDDDEEKVEKEDKEEKEDKSKNERNP